MGVRRASTTTAERMMKSLSRWTQQERERRPVSFYQIAWLIVVPVPWVRRPRLTLAAPLPAPSTPGAARTGGDACPTRPWVRRPRLTLAAPLPAPSTPGAARTGGDACPTASAAAGVG